MNVVFSQMGDVTLVRFDGRLNVEKVKSLGMNKSAFAQGKVIFQLDGLSFVGSSGIQIFFQTLAEIQMINPTARVTGVCSEFLQLLRFSQIANLAIDSNIEQAFGEIIAPTKPMIGASTLEVAVDPVEAA